MNKIMFPLWLFLLLYTFLLPSLFFSFSFASCLLVRVSQSCCSLAFGLLLLLLKKLFLRENQFSYPENWPKIKFPEKSQKIQNKFFLEKRGRETPEVTQGATPGHHTHGRRGLPGGGAWGRSSPNGALQAASSKPPSFSLPKNTGKLAQARVLAVLARDFRSPCSAHLKC